MIVPVTIPPLLLPLDRARLPCLAVYLTTKLVLKLFLEQATGQKVPQKLQKGWPAKQFARILDNSLKKEHIFTRSAMKADHLSRAG
jgi:hypothetical protein